MRALIQRVNKGSVTVENVVKSAINKGLVVLLGIEQNDTREDLEYICRKILNIKLFPLQGKEWKASVMDINGQVLCVSQFTLHAQTKKGTKPDFHLAMSFEKSREMYNDFLKMMQSSYTEEMIKDGVFGEMMNVMIENDGPVTIWIDSKQK